MNLYSFKNDYSEGCHPDLLIALSQNNKSQQIGYGEDYYCLEAAKLIREKCGNEDLSVHFVSGGTQANLLVIAAALMPYESVISASSGHIHVHETGAVEATGHKIQTVSTEDGKLRPVDIQTILDKFEDEHTVKPRLVYISNSTEIGSIYSKKELSDLYHYCKSNSLLLFLDGARLGSALTSTSNDLNLVDIAALTDVFYIGGTKNGALFGEAIVIKNLELKSHFRFHLKQRGALLAKGRALGIQFQELFKNNLFYELGHHANKMAMKLTEAISAQGYTFLTDPVSNQIFPILPNSLIRELNKSFEFYVWKKVDEYHSAIRLVTSWATEEDAVDALINEITRSSY